MSNPHGDHTVGSAHQSQPDGHSPPYGDPAAEIQAEINDHLATATEQLQSHGLEESAARQKSQQKFGDAAAIRRRCYWIKQGDALMFRTAVIALLSILCLALGATVFSTLRSQRQTAEQMAALAEQLKLLAEQQRTPPVAPQPAAPVTAEIGGTVHYGSAGPAAVSEVIVCRAGDGEVVRRLWTGEEGQFHSGPLTPGDYTLIAKGVKGAAQTGISIQTEPFQLYSGRFEVAIDATYRSGRLAVALSRPLPPVEVDGKYTIGFRVVVSGETNELQHSRWTTSRSMPDRWPIYIEHPDWPPSKGNARYAYDFSGLFQGEGGELSDDTLRGPGEKETSKLLTEERLPGGPCAARAAIVMDVMPLNPKERGRVEDRLRDKRDAWMNRWWITNTPLGNLWLEHLLDQTGQRHPTQNLLAIGPMELRKLGTDTKIPIRDGQLTRIRVEIPPDLESCLRTFLDSVTDPDQFNKAVLENNPFIRETQVEVIGTEPLKQPVGGMF